MERSTNALAELARELASLIPKDKDIRELDQRRWNAVDKAQRIVAELAKVEKPIDLRTVGMTHLADLLEADKNRAVEIVRNCRAIAEEEVRCEKGRNDAH